MATPRFTLPDPNRPEAPSLPPELLTKILKFAQADKSPTEQLKTRLNFEKVCRAWFLCDCRWRVVALKDFTALKSLLESLVVVGQAAGGGVVTRRGGAGVSAVVAQMAAKVKTLYLDITYAEAGYKTEKIARLLSLTTALTSIELVVNDWRFGLERDVLDDDTTTALAKLSHVEHFKLTGPYVDLEDAEMRSTTDALIGLAPRWTQLQTIEITNCSPSILLRQGETFSTSSTFRSFKLSNCGPQLSRFDALVAGLPPTTRELSIDDEGAFVEQQPVKPLCDAALNVTKALEVVNITAVDDLSGWGPYPRCQRGLMEQFVTSLDSVTDLTMSPCAISNLKDLSHRKVLTRLELRYNNNQSYDGPEPSELLELIERSSSLKHIVVNMDIASAWIPVEQLHVVLAAQKKGIKFTWVDFDGSEVDPLEGYSEDGYCDCDGTDDESRDELGLCVHRGGYRDW